MTFLAQIWESYRRLPVWVQVWIAFVLVPVNFLSMAFLDEPYGVWVAVLAVGGIAPNLFVLIATRRFGHEMAWSHLVVWPPLVVLLLWILISGPSVGHAWFLVLLLVVDFVSIVFDAGDVWKARKARV